LEWSRTPIGTAAHTRINAGEEAPIAVAAEGSYRTFPAVAGKIAWNSRQSAAAVTTTVGRPCFAILTGRFPQGGIDDGP
ncbi:MAG TPA: hypothetical protein PLV87_12855, partial [Opitutaceae bacterium]|nr:hypothetical protein [Opitutaceae bacterium]